MADDAVRWLAEFARVPGMPADKVVFATSLSDLLRHALALSRHKQAGGALSRAQTETVERAYQKLVNAWLELRYEFWDHDAPRDPTLDPTLMSESVSEAVFVACCHLAHAVLRPSRDAVLQCLARVRAMPGGAFIEINPLRKPFFPDGAVTVAALDFVFKCLLTRYTMFSHMHLYAVYHLLLGILSHAHAALAALDLETDLAADRQDPDAAYVFPAPPDLLRGAAYQVNLCFCEMKRPVRGRGRGLGTPRGVPDCIPILQEQSDARLGVPLLGWAHGRTGGGGNTGPRCCGGTRC